MEQKENDRRPVGGNRDQSGVPEFEPHDQSAAERATENVLNTFTVERDTSLAEGAGAPGSTNVGGSKRKRD